MSVDPMEIISNFGFGSGATSWEGLCSSLAALLITIGIGGVFFGVLRAGVGMMLGGRIRQSAKEELIQKLVLAVAISGCSCALGIMLRIGQVILSALHNSHF